MYKFNAYSMPAPHDSKSYSGMKKFEETVRDQTAPVDGIELQLEAT